MDGAVAPQLRDRISFFKFLLIPNFENFQSGRPYKGWDGMFPCTAASSPQPVMDLLRTAFHSVYSTATLVILLFLYFFGVSLVLL